MKYGATPVLALISEALPANRIATRAVTEILRIMAPSVLFQWSITLIKRQYGKMDLCSFKPTYECD